MASKDNGYLQKLEDLRTHFYQKEALNKFDCTFATFEIALVGFLFGVAFGVILDRVF